VAGVRDAPVVDGARPTVVVVGLGPAGPELTTPAVTEAILHATHRYLRTGRHPAAAPFLAAGVPTFDALYEQGADFDATYAAIVETLVEAAIAGGRVVYAVPGSPAVLERTVAMLRADPRVAVETMAGLSFLDIAWDRLEIDPVNEGVRLINGERFAQEAANDRGPLLVSHTWSNEILSQIKLSAEGDESATAILCHHLGLPDEQVMEVAFDDLDRTLVADHLTCLFLAGLSVPPASALARAAEVVATLRVECPWDREQTHRSLVRHLLEESYEAIEAIEELGEPPDLAASEHLEEELGDLLCQVLFHATIAQEEGLFTLADVAGSLADKLMHRHPHVYPPTGEASDGQSTIDAESVMANWEAQKLVEKGRESLTDGIPTALPALAYATKIERKLTTVHFGLALTQERTVFAEALERFDLADEHQLGALLLLIARRAAAGGIDAEAALRVSARELRDRFVAVERQLATEGRHFNDLDATERKRLWEVSGPR
jgi:tetrapyrrole methylase family protein/MazG family protein